MGRYSSNSSYYLFLVVFFFAFCLSGNGVYAFGAGNIPSKVLISIAFAWVVGRFAYMEGRAFRHGDIEDTLQELIKKGSGGFALASMLSKGSKFGGLDIKRVYFGNWLRDYSQAVDIASLKKLPLQTIINLCMALGFLAHGYATHEFEVTAERLGVYLPTEHIDNPKGYGEGEDARKYHPNLRPPVDPQELEIDPRTGMKNYIANENGHWDTSKALVRRTLEQCIHRGRMHRQNGQKADEYEAYRLLGQLLHTLEDFPAHSNFCELSLISMGYTQVFSHVGDQVRVQAPNGKWVPPIVTGSFGSSDFVHSLLGEATDHLASVTDLNRELDKARSKSATATRGGPGSGAPLNPADALRDLFFTIPGGSGTEMSRDLEQIERIRAGPAGGPGAPGGGKNPDEMSPQELHAVLWQVLTFRDSVVKKIEKTIEKIPGLGPLIEKIMDSISVFVFTTLEPFLKPILKTATTGLSAASGEVIDNHDQYEVFNDPRCSDPTHSFLSKDHFNLILNEPAGQVAKIIVAHTVKRVVDAWDNPSVNVHELTEDVLQCLFHPDFHNSNSKVQREMLQYMRDWISKVPNQHSVIQRLSKEAVRNHQNTRLAGEGGAPAADGSFAQTEAHNFQHAIGGYVQGIPVVGQVAGMFNEFSASSGPRRDISGPGSGAPPFPGGQSPHAVPSPVPPMGGQAASYYGGGPSGPPLPSGPGGYAPPSGPPGGYAPPSGPPPGGYQPPSGPPMPGSGPSFPQHEPHRQGSGYEPSYSSYPEAQGHHGHHAGGYAPPAGPPPGGFPAPAPGSGGFGMPGPDAPGASPFGFPGADPYEHPHGHHGQHHHQQQHPHPHHQGPPPQFPGADTSGGSGGQWFGGGQPGNW
ncbi:hypothetical protein CVT26_012030 [Gymnopilus dilepis]|uniref:Het-C-domain-containing protein n=1 Tax=Gymnopilus dilepis TaxID=231916 RepID=A0A409WP16_9AGAR|nr:hypothetical protein CVT26_012030 [Gymnopilus dilepis]